MKRDSGSGKNAAQALTLVLWAAPPTPKKAALLYKMQSNFNKLVDIFS